VTAGERSRPIYVRPWRIDLVIREGVEPVVPGARLARLVAAALERAGAPGRASIGLVLAGDRELARLNREAMGKRGPTDVLSFPLLPPEAFPPHPGREAGAGAAGGAPAPGRAFALPPGVRAHRGDVVVSVERAVAQAREGRGGHDGRTRWGPADELCLLVVHGVLHVCGWDHAEATEQAAMRAVESEILGATGVAGAARWPG
jgi:probable rRNA maturation factor